MLLNLDEYDKVDGEIYKITNTINNKFYVGQTRSHRLNHAKYRPFGYLKRFRDHISEAFSNKKNQSRYLNSAILKYGKENFICEKILTCKVEDLDTHERHYILFYNSKYPTGYNLTDGGQSCGSLKGDKILLNESEIVKPIVKEKEKRDLKKSDYTKALISERLKAFNTDTGSRILHMERAQCQHYNVKFERFRDVSPIDKENIEKYIFVATNHKLNYQYINVIIDGKVAQFIGKYDTIENIKIRAVHFIQELIKWQCDQIAGNHLELSLPL